MKINTETSKTKAYQCLALAVLIVLLSVILVKRLPLEVEAASYEIASTEAIKANTSNLVYAKLNYCLYPDNIETLSISSGINNNNLVYTKDDNKNEPVENEIETKEQYGEIENQNETETDELLVASTDTASTVEIEESALESTVQTVNERYAAIGNLSQSEIDDLAKIVWLEARGESEEGQQAVVEVILNRVVSDKFPNTVEEVIHQGENTDVPQFSSIGALDTATPIQTQYEAVSNALYGTNILPIDIVFFSCSAENDNIWGTIGAHTFCYPYYYEN